MERVEQIGVPSKEGCCCYSGVASGELIGWADKYRGRLSLPPVFDCPFLSPQLPISHHG